MSTEFFGTFPINFHLFRILNTFWVFSEKRNSLSAWPFHIWLCLCLHILMCISYWLCMNTHKNTHCYALIFFCDSISCFRKLLPLFFYVLYCSQPVFSHYYCANNPKHSIILTRQWPEVMFILELKTLESVVTWTSFAKSSYLLAFSEGDGGRYHSHVW